MRLLFIMLTLISYTGVAFSDTQSQEPAYVILDKTTNEIEKLFPLKICGEGVAMPGGIIRKFNLSFNTKIVLSKEDLRGLLIKTS